MTITAGRFNMAPTITAIGAMVTIELNAGVEIQ